MSDFRFALRTFLRNPGFTAVVVLTLGLGTGANTAIFSVVNAVLLRPLPYENSERLVRIVQNRPPGTADGLPQRSMFMSTDDAQGWRERTRTLSQLALYSPAALTLTDAEGPVRLDGAQVSPALFPMLSAQPLMGRVFSDEEDRPGADAVVILGESLWRDRLGADPAVVGRALLLDERAYTVVGVMPASFQFPDREAQFWVPFVLRPVVRVPGERRIQAAQAIARVRDDVSFAQATAEANVIYQQLRAEDAAFDAGPGRGGPGARGRGTAAPGPSGGVIRQGGPGPPPDGAPIVRRGGPGRGAPPLSSDAPPPPGSIEFGANTTIELVSVQDAMVEPVRPALVVLLGAVGLVLLVACANVANLLLARGLGRRQELGVRAALGASRGRLLRQVLIESTALAAGGGVLGVALATGGVGLLNLLGPDSIPRLDEIAIDGPVLSFTVLLTLLTGIVFGLLPALRFSRPDGLTSLQEGLPAARAGFDPLRRGGTRSILAMAEIALATVLLVGAGLLSGSFTNLARVDPGYAPGNLLTFQVALPQSRYSPEQRQAFYTQALDSLQATPGVVSAATTNTLPLEPGRMRIAIDVQDLTGAGSQGTFVASDIRIVSTDYVAAVGLDLLEGRTFSVEDGAGRPPVILVNETFASRHFPGGAAVGQTIRLNGPEAIEIVGLVGDVRHSGLDAEPEPELYLDSRQTEALFPGLPSAPGGAFFAVRTSGDPAALTPAVRALFQRVDPQITVDNVATMEQRLSDSVAQPRFYAVLLAVFSGVAALLAAVGIYGVIAYSVVQRTREIGIRMALGARTGAVLWLVMGQGALIAGVGLAAGLAGASAVTRYLEAMLFGLTPLDLTTFAAVAVLFAAVATLACYVPAARAIRINPATALRAE